TNGPRRWAWCWTGVRAASLGGSVPRPAPWARPSWSVLGLCPRGADVGQVFAHLPHHPTHPRINGRDIKAERAGPCNLPIVAPHALPVDEAPAQQNGAEPLTAQLLLRAHGSEPARAHDVGGGEPDDVSLLQGD